MFEQAAASYPGAFSGYKLRVIESHQSTKQVTFLMEPNYERPSIIACNSFAGSLEAGT